MNRHRRLRKLVPDPELFRRRAAGETLRAIAPDYGVSAAGRLGRRGLVPVLLHRPDLAPRNGGQHAHAVASVGHINWPLFHELNRTGPPLWWLDQQKNTSDGLTWGLVRLNPPPDCADRGSYLADALTEELEAMLAQGWTVIDSADLDKLSLGHLIGER